MNLLIKTEEQGVFAFARYWFVSLALAIAMVLFSQAVRASDDDFNAPDGGVWMSLEHFTDKTDRFPELMQAIRNKLPEPERQNVAAPVAPPPDSGQTQTGETVSSPAPSPEQGEPVRALSLPVLPGVNGGYDLQVSSTGEEKQEQGPESFPLVQPRRQLTPPVMPGLAAQQDSTAGEHEQMNDDEIEAADTTETAAAATAEAEAARAAALVQKVQKLSLPVLPGMVQSRETADLADDEDEEATGLSAAEAEAAAKEAALAAEKAAKTAAIIQAVRQISLPVLPGVGQSTVADATVLAAEESEATTGAPAKQNSLSIRYASLPGLRPATTDKSAAKALVADVAGKKVMTKKGKTVASPPTPACEALTAYRRRQLAAIESDRRTLSALQSAIAELGLDKQLDFLTGSKGRMSGPQSREEQTSPVQPRQASPVQKTPVSSGPAKAKR